MQQSIMKKTQCLTFLSIIALFTFLTGCKPKRVAPVSERIAKVWTAQQVSYNGTTVYTRGATSNVESRYTGFRLDLSAAPTVQYTEFENSKFTGQYSVPSDDRLQLTNLNPQPTGTNGIIDFTISDLTDNSVTLTRTSTSAKTGGTTNVYKLTSP